MQTHSRVVALGSIILLPLSVSCSPDTRTLPSEPAGLVGAWLIVETSRTTPDSSRVNGDPQPGLYIFTDRHFSIMLIPGDSARRNMIAKIPDVMNSGAGGPYRYWLGDTLTLRFTAGWAAGGSTTYRLVRLE